MHSRRGASRLTGSEKSGRCCGHTSRSNGWEVLHHPMLLRLTDCSSGWHWISSRPEAKGNISPTWHHAADQVHHSFSHLLPKHQVVATVGGKTPNSMGHWLDPLLRPPCLNILERDSSQMLSIWICNPLPPCSTVQGVGT